MAPSNWLRVVRPCSAFFFSPNTALHSSRLTAKPSATSTMLGTALIHSKTGASGTSTPIELCSHSWKYSVWNGAAFR